MCVYVCVCTHAYINTYNIVCVRTGMRENVLEFLGKLLASVLSLFLPQLLCV